MTTQVRFGLPVSGLLNNTSDDFLGSVEWRQTDSAACGSKGSNFSLRTIGMCWKQQCLDRTLSELSGEKPRFSSLDDAVGTAGSGSILAVLARVRSETTPAKRPPKGNLKKQVKSTSRLSREATELLRLWLSQGSTEAEESPEALLACCELLALYGSQFPAEVIGGLWRATLAAALAQSESFITAAETEDWQELLDNSVETRATWLKAGLLPLVCGSLFDDVKGAPRLLRAGRTALGDQLQQVTDADGVPVPEVYDSLSPFLNLWSDGLLISELFGEPLWKKSASKRFDKMLRRLSAAVRADVRLMSCPNGEDAVAALNRAYGVSGIQTGAEKLKALKDEAGPAKKAPTKKSKRRAAKKISKAAIPSWQSDETDAACLRTSWGADASVATVRFEDEPVQLELAVAGVPLLSGSWGLEIAEADEQLELEAEWECICWNSDSDGDYLELQLEFEGGPMINRYLYLSRSDSFAVFADIISGANPSRVDLVTQLPFADGVTLTPVENAREQLLIAGDKTVRVFPLTMPQDPGVGTSGRIGLDQDSDQPCLTCSHATDSGMLFAPIVLDWAPERQAAQAEWRKLTVTRATEIDSAGAGAFRLKVGKQHLVLYRSLGGTERYRTFLGYQAESETVIGKFTKSGVIQELVIVE